MVKTDAKEATHFAAGNIEYYTCTKSHCAKLYTDEAGTNEITLEDTIIKQIPHNYSELKTDETNHWYECSCGDIKDLEAHEFGAPEKGDTEHWYTCECGYEKGRGTHTYGDWTVVEKATCLKDG